MLHSFYRQKIHLTNIDILIHALFYSGFFFPATKKALENENKKNVRQLKEVVHIVQTSINELL